MTARRMLKVDPSSSIAYAFLAFALYAEGRPLESVRLAFAAQIERTRAKAVTPLSVRFRLAVLEGRFDEALIAIAQWDEALRDTQDDKLHVDLLGEHARVLFEIGRPRDAGALARDYLKRRAGWTPDLSNIDPEGFVNAIRYRAGDLARESFVRIRESWRAAEWKRLELDAYPAGRSALWFAAYASVSSKGGADAKDAVDALGRFAPLPGAFYRDVEMDEALGATLLHAQRAQEALTPLRRAASSCLAASSPFEHTHALGELGEALQRAGDREGACRAYAAVISRWGAARPTSVTAERVRARARALRCRGAD